MTINEENMSTQYDVIQTKYKGMEDLPCRELEKPSISLVLGRVDGLTCLDLACGLGRWSEFLVESGASHVVGVDISSGMIDSARDAAKALPENIGPKLEFHAADCGKPFIAPGGGGWRFDLVFAAWFLNYASTYEEMVQMFTNIYNNLTPGGRFVRLTSNTHCPMYEPFDDRYGVIVEAVHEIKDGWKCRLEAYTEPEHIQFEMYHFLHGFYERAAVEAGLTPIRWHGYVLPDDERKDNGYWDIFMLRPHFNILSCHRPT